MVLRQNQVTTCMCQKLQLKNGSLRYSSQTFDLPASDSGLRMSSSRIAPPPPPATVIFRINNNVTCFEVEMVLENAIIVRPGDQNKEGNNLRWASMGHRATHHWSGHLELMEVGRVCSIFRCLSFSVSVFVVSSDHDHHHMLIRKRRSQRATCNPPPPPPT